MQRTSGAQKARIVDPEIEEATMRLMCLGMDRGTAEDLINQYSHSYSYQYFSRFGEAPKLYVPLWVLDLI